MFYAKLDANGILERYPYTLTDLRFDKPNVSFPVELDEATVISFGLVPVRPTLPPADTYAINLSRTAVLRNSEWVEEWIETLATPEQVTERTIACANDVRQQRNWRLAECDWTQFNDSPLDLDGKNAWALYREALRMVPQQEGFPWTVNWPPKPGT